VAVIRGADRQLAPPKCWIWSSSGFLASNLRAKSVVSPQNHEHLPRSFGPSAGRLIVCDSAGAVHASNYNALDYKNVPPPTYPAGVITLLGLWPRLTRGPMVDRVSDQGVSMVRMRWAQHLAAQSGRSVWYSGGPRIYGLTMSDLIIQDRR